MQLLVNHTAGQGELHLKYHALVWLLGIFFFLELSLLMKIIRRLSKPECLCENIPKFGYFRSTQRQEPQIYLLVSSPVACLKPKHKSG